MRKLVLGCIGVAVLSLVPTTSAAPAKTYVSHNCTSQKIEPRQIMFACGDGGFYADHLDWSGWGRFRAKGEGIFHKNDCDPDCAGGEFHARHGKITLKNRMWCKDAHKFMFRRAKMVYNRPFFGEKEESFRLFCPF